MPPTSVRVSGVGNLAGTLKVLPRISHVRQIGRFYQTEPEYGSEVAKLPGIEIDEVIGKIA